MEYFQAFMYCFTFGTAIIFIAFCCLGIAEFVLRFCFGIDINKRKNTKENKKNDKSSRK